nr:MAG: glycosyl transferase family 2 [Bacillota bacterium]
MRILDLIMTTLEGFLLAYTVYTIGVGLLGLKRRPGPPEAAPSRRFALITAAHNEEAVIAPHIESLLQIDYPREMFDIYILCDNCTDRTVAIARRYEAQGVRVLERRDPLRRGKGFALEWGFAQVLKEPCPYDAVVVFDADNLVSPNILRVMNNHLAAGAKAVQAYLDAKNPWDSWISACYSVAYWSTNRVWQLARHHLGLSAALGGTGMCLDVQTLKRLGWGTATLTEDLEYTAKLVLHGLRVEWAHDARVYDEKPLTLTQTFRQRTRWLAGHWNVALRYVGPLLERFLRTGCWRYADTAIYLLQPFLIVLGAGVGVVAIANAAMGGELYTSLIHRIPPDLGAALAMGVYCYPMLGLIADRAPLRSYLYYLSYLLFGLTWIPIAFIGFFRRNDTHWAHTQHTRAIRMSELGSAR